MSRSFKFVAFFMLLFVLVDVCAPEHCQAMASGTQDNQAQTQQQSTTSDPCQFEEDCFSCAHYAPGASLHFACGGVVSLAVPDVFLTVPDGSFVLPYHPPRQ